MTKLKNTVLVSIHGKGHIDHGTVKVECTMHEHFDNVHLKGVHRHARGRLGLKKRDYVLSENPHPDLELENAVRAHFSLPSGAMFSERVHNPLQPSYSAYKPLSIGGHAILYSEASGGVTYAKVNFDWEHERSAMAPSQVS